MKTKKLFMIAAVFSLLVFLNLPLMAQHVTPAGKRYCPYCDMGNIKTCKFCGVCGAKLADPILSFSANGKALHIANLGMWIPDMSFANDYAATKIFGDGKDLSNTRRQGSITWPIVGGIVAGGAGFLVGGFSGAAYTSDPTADFSAIGGFIAGAPIGEAICLPIGVHLGNGRRGNFPLALLASLGTVGTGILLTSAFGDYRTPAFSLPLTALAQLVACVAIERATGHSR